MTPGYYSSLPPFRDLFSAGLPILTYHKVGRPPFGARLKGLYMPRRTFARQLVELRSQGFESGPLGAVASHTATSRRIVLTFDDGFRSVLRQGAAPLRENGFTAINYLVADRLGMTNDWDVPLGEVEEPLMSIGEVREWLAAGHEIGSHTLSHPRLTHIPAGTAREEITASRQKLEDLFQRPVEHFCYPYGDWNPAVRDLVEEAGYRTATTVDFGVNPPGTDAFALKRVTARYPSFRPAAWFRARLARLKGRSGS